MVNYTYILGSPVQIQTPAQQNSIDRSITEPPSLLSPRSILPLRSLHCAFIPAGKNVIISIFFTLFKFPSPKSRKLKFYVSGTVLLCLTTLWIIRFRYRRKWMDEYGALVEWYRRGKAEASWQKPVPVPRFLPQIPRGLFFLYCIAVGSRRLMPPDALQPKAYCTSPGL